MSENNMSEIIMETLENHPEGLTILGIAENTGLNRLTVSKYALVMAAKGSILQRKVGSAKLCYKKGGKNDEEKQ
jgi:hypothetical protein